MLAALLLFSGCRSADFPNEVHSPDDLPGRVIGVLEGSSSIKFASELGSVSVFADSDRLLNALRSGLVDCILMERAAADILVSGARGVRILTETLLEYDLRIAVPKENVQLLSAVNSALAQLRRDGTLAGLRDKYFIGAYFTYTPSENAAQRSGYLRIAVPYGFAPYAFTDGYGQLVGMSVDIAHAVADILGVDVYIDARDAGDLVTTVWFGRADFALGFVPEDSDAELVNFSDSYAQSVQAIIVRR